MALSYIVLLAFLGFSTLFADLLLELGAPNDRRRYSYTIQRKTD